MIIEPSSAEISTITLTPQTDPRELKLWLDRLVRFRNTVLAPRFREPNPEMHAKGFLPRYLPLLPLKGDLQGWMIETGLKHASKFFGEDLEIDIAHNSQGNVVGFAFPFVPIQDLLKAAHKGYTPVKALKHLAARVYTDTEAPNTYSATEVAISPSARRAMIEILYGKEQKVIAKGATHLAAAHHVNNQASARLQARRGFEEVGVTRSPLIPFSKMMLRVKFLKDNKDYK